MNVSRFYTYRHPKSYLLVLDDHTFKKRQIAWQFRSEVTLIQPGIVLKEGTSVRPPEKEAMAFVRNHLPHIPVPRVHASAFRFENGLPIGGELEMDFMPGRTLRDVWTGLDDQTKDRVCYDIWHLVDQIRAVKRPDDLRPGLYRTIDGSPSFDPLLGDRNDLAPREIDDDTLRSRMYLRYIAHNGLSYRDSDNIRESLPQSDKSVFCHGDISPGNLIVDDNANITGVIDWESSGWFPDYWEYAQMMKFCHPSEHEWQKYMEKTRPVPWDITAIQKLRRVLF